MREIHLSSGLKVSLFALVFALLTCVFAAAPNTAWAADPTAASASTSAEGVTCNISTPASTTGSAADSALVALANSQLDGAGTFSTLASNPLKVTVAGTVDYDSAHNILPLVNQARSAVGASALTWDYSLEESAIQRAAEIYIYYDHTRPNGSDCFTAFKGLSAGMYSAGENIQMGSYVIGTSAANQNWTNSPGHYGNMIDTNYTRFAAACFVGSNGYSYWVEVFAGFEPGSGTYVDQGSQWKSFTIESSADHLDFSQAGQAGLMLNVGRSATYNWAPAGTTGVVSGIRCSSSNRSVVTTETQSATLNAIAPGTSTITLYEDSTGKQLAQTTVTVRSCYLFNDVSVGDWYATPSVLGYSVENGLLTGYSDSQFGGYNAVTRGQVVTILWRIAGQPTATAQAFADVDYSQYYGQAVRWARSTGVAEGYGQGTSATFCADNPVTREELCVMLQRYTNKVAKISTTPSSASLKKLAAFPDSGSVSSWANNAVAWAIGEGLISGDTSTGQALINPQGTAYRCAAAKMVTVMHRDVLKLGK